MPNPAMDSAALARKHSHVMTDASGLPPARADSQTFDARALVAAAMEARVRAHAPYSGLHVGASIALAGGGAADMGDIVSGCNVESASFSLTLCAERVAATRAIAEGRSPGDFIAIAVAADGTRPIPPCGACRQFLFDLAPELEVLIVAPDGSHRTHRLADLLPEAFDGAFLHRPDHRQEP